MRVFLVRHAIAEERSRIRWPDDSLRPLTAAGVKRFRKAARGLATLLPPDAALLTSPFVRARDTAVMLSAAASLRGPIECPELSAGTPIQTTFGLLAGRREKAVILVGHEPDLGALLAAALAGEDAKFAVQFKKGGAACVEFRARIAPGRATLRWLLPPKILRALG